MNKTIEELVRKAFTNPYSGEKQDLSPIDESDFREALTKAYEAGQVDGLKYAEEYTLHNAHIGGPGMGFPRLEEAFRAKAESLKAKTDE